MTLDDLYEACKKLKVGKLKTFTLDHETTYRALSSIAVRLFKEKNMIVSFSLDGKTLTARRTQ